MPIGTIGMNPVQHTEQVIKRGRAFFDDWLERFPSWDDFVQAPLYGSLPEFGPRRETAVKLVTEWLGGAAEAPHNYANIVKYGVGEVILSRFTGIPDSTIKAALRWTSTGAVASLAAVDTAICSFAWAIATRSPG